MTVADAAYQTAHSFAEGTEVLAQKMGIGKQVLTNKLNANNTTHHLTLEESVRLMRVTGDVRLLHALSDEFGGVYVPLPEQGSAQTSSVLGDISKMSVEFGALVREVADDIQDGVITPNEHKRIQHEAAELRHALARLMADLDAMFQASQREHRSDPPAA